MQLICWVVDTLNLVSFDDNICLELAVCIDNRTILDEVGCEILVLRGKDRRLL